MIKQELELMIEAFIRMMKANGLLAVEIDVKAFDGDITFHHIRKVHDEIYNSPIYKKIKEECK